MQRSNYRWRLQMTKQEFASQIDEIVETDYPTVGHYMDALVLCHEQYISSLEAENKQLKTENDTYRKGHDFNLVMEYSDDMIKLKSDNARLMNALEKALETHPVGCPVYEHPCIIRLEN